MIYFQTQVVDGQRKVICLLEKQIENVSVFFFSSILSFIFICNEKWSSDLLSLPDFVINSIPSLPVTGNLCSHDMTSRKYFMFIESSRICPGVCLESPFKIVELIPV